MSALRMPGTTGWAALSICGPSRHDTRACAFVTHIGGQLCLPRRYMMRHMVMADTKGLEMQAPIPTIFLTSTEKPKRPDQSLFHVIHAMHNR